MELAIGMAIGIVARHGIDYNSYNFYFLSITF